MGGREQAEEGRGVEEGEEEEGEGIKVGRDPVSFRIQSVEIFGNL